MGSLTRTALRAGGHPEGRRHPNMRLSPGNKKTSGVLAGVYSRKGGGGAFPSEETECNQGDGKCGIDKDEIGVFRSKSVVRGETTLSPKKEHY